MYKSLCVTQKRIWPSMFEFTPNTTDGNDKEKVNISAWKPFGCICSQCSLKETETNCTSTCFFCR